MTIYRDKIRGCWVVSAIVDGYLKTRRYYGYTKREAITAFKQEG